MTSKLYNPLVATGVDTYLAGIGDDAFPCTDVLLLSNERCSRYCPAMPRIQRRSNALQRACAQGQVAYRYLTADILLGFLRCCSR
jgi:hypothetical protein